MRIAPRVGFHFVLGERVSGVVLWLRQSILYAMKRRPFSWWVLFFNCFLWEREGVVVRWALFIVLDFVRVPKNGQIFVQWGMSTSSIAKAKYLIERWEGWEVGYNSQSFVSTYSNFAPVYSCVASFFGCFLGSKGIAIMNTTCVSLAKGKSGLRMTDVVHLMGKGRRGLTFLVWFRHTVPTEDQIGELCDGKPSHMVRRAHIFEDPHSPQFMCYLSILTFFMLMLMTRDNSLQLFLLSLASYLLIHLWFTVTLGR